METFSKNVDVQEPFRSESVTSFPDFCENDDVFTPSEFNSSEDLLILPTDTFDYQSSVASFGSPSMNSSIQNIYPRTETLDGSLPYLPVNSSEDSPCSSVRPCSSSSNALIFSPRMNRLEDNLRPLPVHAKPKEISLSHSSPRYSHSRTETSNSNNLSVDSHPEQPWSSISLEESYSLVGAGLANLGNTCFMNAILQCMAHTTLLVQGLRTADHLQICQSGNECFCIFCALHDHIEHSLSSSGAVVYPHKFADNLTEISSYFKKFQQEDAHEFLQCLLDKLRGPSLFIIGSINRFACESDNLVRSIFGGRLISKIRCSNCGHLSDNFEPLMDMSLDIENANSLLGALESFTKVEKLQCPEIIFTCQNCREIVSIEKQFMINEAPSVATFQLKKFKSDGFNVEKIKKHVKFPLELDLKPYTWSSCDSDVELRYELYAVVEHVGEVSTSGHYISFVRPSPNSWFRLDDSEVTLVPENYVLFREAYILFYTKKGTPWAYTLMESQKLRLDNNASIALPVSAPDDSCHRDFEIGRVVPSQSSSHPLSTQLAGAVKEFDTNLGKDASKSGADIYFCHTLKPDESPKTPGRCVPRACAKPEKHVIAGRPRKTVGGGIENGEAAGPVKKAMDNSERREALRYVRSSMPSARRAKLVEAMLDPQGPSSKARKRPRMSQFK